MAVYNQPAAQPNDRLTQADLMQRIDPKGNVKEIAEVLTETNEIVQDAVFHEGNLPTGDVQTVRTSLPDVYYGRFNQGVPASRSSVASITEECSMIEARSQIDCRMADLNGNGAAYRRQEEKPFIEAMGQKFAWSLFHGNVKNNREEFNGFMRRYDSTKITDLHPQGKNVIDCGATEGSARRGSIWLIDWGDDVYCPYPMGSEAGLKTKDLGQQLVPDENGNPFLCYVTMFSWKVGLMVRDWRRVLRLANIDVDALMAGSGVGTGDIKTAGSENLIMILQDALTKFPRKANTNLRLYMSPDLFSGLQRTMLRTDIDVVQFNTAKDQFGSWKSWGSILGIPIRQVDQLSTDEALIA